MKILFVKIENGAIFKLFAYLPTDNTTERTLVVW